MSNHAHTPTTEQIELLVLAQLKQSAERHGLPHDIDADRADFRRWLATIRSAAEQRGAEKSLRDAAESKNLIDHMYANLHVNQPIAVRETSKYLHNRADRIADQEGDDE